MEQNVFAFLNSYPHCYFDKQVNLSMRFFPSIDVHNKKNIESKKLQVKVVTYSSVITKMPSWTSGLVVTSKVGQIKKNLLTKVVRHASVMKKNHQHC